jgi:hypothetical protein
MMADEIEFPNFKKIKAMIPTSLYEEMASKNIFLGNFDAWITEAIIEKLRKKEEDGS